MLDAGTVGGHISGGDNSETRLLFPAMSDPLKHECGLAYIRLKHPLAYYYEKYGTSLWGLNKLYLLMEKQRNRGQDGVGIGCCKLDAELGQPYMFRTRSAKKDSLNDVIKKQFKKFDALSTETKQDPEAVKREFEFGGEILIGHLRYGTSGTFSEGGCHPFVRRSNWPTKSLMVAGNFNMTNARDLNHHLIERGQHPVFGTDTQTVLEEVGFHLDEQHDEIYRRERDKGTAGPDIPHVISQELDPFDIIKRCGEIWDGGYAIAGAIGNGDSFVLRDPTSIRPCHYYEDDEVIAFASERAPLMTGFGVETSDVSELPGGHVAVIKADGEFSITRFTPEREAFPCSFERIYFSRGNDPEIYLERKALGKALVPRVMKAIDGDLERAVFSFVPNTAEIAYHGMMDGLRENRRDQVKAAIIEASNDGVLTEELIDELILRNWPRGEKIAHKDAKLRTFISQEKGRNQMVSHVYDISYDVVKEGDALVVIDDSIVRGTTLRESILRILARTGPRKIVIASTAPQIRYPDCYGIDMSILGNFIAFQAAVKLLEKRSQTKIIAETYYKALEELKKPDPADMVNCVKAIYDPFTPEEISSQIAELVTPEACECEVEVIYLSIHALHQSIPKHHGDWYFTGDYPTPGGKKVVNQAFIQYYEKREGRPYDVWF